MSERSIETSSPHPTPITASVQVTPCKVRRVSGAAVRGAAFGEAGANARYDDAGQRVLDTHAAGQALPLVAQR